MGSGTTGMATLNTGRFFIGFKLDEHYYEMAKSRIKAAIISCSLETCVYKE